MENFRKLGIIEPVLKSIEEEKFENPTEIQEKSIPLILAGKDVIAGSATGSGKTLAFASGIIENCEKRKGIQALILTPTRELAEQVSEALKKFSKYKPLNVNAIYGGVAIDPQIRGLTTADVVVGTPGRLLDHIERRTIRLGEVKTLVLDEADRMLDMGFIDDVEKIMKQCKRERQTLLFSATISRDIAYLARKYMKEPVEVSAEHYVDAKKLTQVYYEISDGLKFSLLVHLLKHEESGLVMVFCNTRRNTDFVANNLEAAGIAATAIHGGLTQSRRTSIMKHFNSQEVYVLVCTDVASRGLDISGVSHIYNYDVPNDSTDYIHRIGRTARAGKEGKAIIILSSKDHDNFRRVMRDNEVEITREATPNVERVAARKFEKPKTFNRGRRGDERVRSGRRASRGNFRRR